MLTAVNSEKYKGAYDRSLEANGQRINMFDAESDVRYINDAIAITAPQQNSDKPPPTGESAAMTIEGGDQQAEHAETECD